MNWLYLRGALRRWTQRLWRRLPLDLPLTGALLLLAGIGLAVLYSASGGNWNQVGNQAARLALGFAVLLVLSRVPPAILRSRTL